MIKKKIKKLPSDYFICGGCNRKVNAMWITMAGNRCLNCIINGNMVFLQEDEDGFKKDWVKAEWKKDGKEIQELKITKQEQQSLNKEINIQANKNEEISSFFSS